LFADRDQRVARSHDVQSDKPASAKKGFRPATERRKQKKSRQAARKAEARAVAEAEAAAEAAAAAAAAGALAASEERACLAMHAASAAVISKALTDGTKLSLKRQNIAMEQILTAFRHARAMIDVVQAAASAPKPQPIRYSKTAIMLIAASAHTVSSWTEMRLALEDNECDFLLNRHDLQAEEAFLDDWCNWAEREEERRMVASLPQRFDSPSPPRRYSRECLEVKRGLRSRDEVMALRGTPAKAVFRPLRKPVKLPFQPLRKVPPTWAEHYRH
jgi:hypothetical protein